MMGMRAAAWAAPTAAATETGRPRTDPISRRALLRAATRNGSGFGQHDRGGHRGRSVDHLQVPRQAAALGAEEEGIASPIPNGGKRQGRTGAEGPDPVDAEDLGDLLEGVDNPEFEVLPVVETSASAVGVVEVEAQGPDQPERGADGHAGPADGADVAGDLRPIEDDVQPSLWSQRPGIVPFDHGGRGHRSRCPDFLVAHRVTFDGGADPRLGGGYREWSGRRPASLVSPLEAAEASERTWLAFFGLSVWKIPSPLPAPMAEV